MYNVCNCEYENPNLLYDLCIEVNIPAIKIMRMMYYSVMTQAYSEKEIPSSPNRSRTYNLPITSSDALPALSC